MAASSLDIILNHLSIRQSGSVVGKRYVERTDGLAIPAFTNGRRKKQLIAQLLSFISHNPLHPHVFAHPTQSYYVYPVVHFVYFLCQNSQLHSRCTAKLILTSVTNSAKTFGLFRSCGVKTSRLSAESTFEDLLIGRLQKWKVVEIVSTYGVLLLEEDENVILRVKCLRRTCRPTCIHSSAINVGDKEN